MAQNLPGKQGKNWQQSKPDSCRIGAGDPMMNPKDWWRVVRSKFYEDFTAATLKTLIVVWAILVIFLVLFVVQNKWLLATILAYEVLP